MHASQHFKTSDIHNVNNLLPVNQCNKPHVMQCCSTIASFSISGSFHVLGHNPQLLIYWSPDLLFTYPFNPTIIVSTVLGSLLYYSIPPFHSSIPFHWFQTPNKFRGTIVDIDSRRGLRIELCHRSQSKIYKLAQYISNKTTKELAHFSYKG